MEAAADTCSVRLPQSDLFRELLVLLIDSRHCLSLSLRGDIVPIEGASFELDIREPVDELERNPDLLFQRCIVSRDFQ